MTNWGVRAALIALVAASCTAASSPAPTIGALATGGAAAAATALPAAPWPVRSQATAAAMGRPFTFESSDGVELAGREFGAGPAVVVLSHMGEAENNQSDWYAFAAALADHGYRSITYNRRGVCPGEDAGCSAGTVDSARAWEDLLGAITYARANGGSRLIAAGASFGADTSLLAGLDPAGPRVQGIVWIAGSLTSSWRGDSVTSADIAAIRTPLLIMSADHDPFAAFVPARVLFEQATSEKRFILVPSTLHGTAMLAPMSDPVAAGQVLQAVLTFLDGDDSSSGTQPPSS